MNNGLLTYLAALLLFGSNGIIAAAIALPSSDIVLLRTFLGALSLVTILAITQRHKLQAPSRPREAAALLLSGAALGASWIFLFRAYQTIGVGVSSLLYYCGPIIVMALSPLIFGEKLTGGKIAGFIAVACGAFLIAAQGLGGNMPIAGIACGIASAFCYALMVIASKGAPHIEGLENSALQVSAAFVTALILTFFTQGVPSFLSPSIAAGIDWRAVAMLGMSCALLGRALLFGAMYDTFRVAAVGEPDYLVTVTAGGAAKRRGSAQGFSRCAQREDAASHWQGVLLPVLLAASLVFAVLSTLRRGERLLFLWNWGVLLTAINMLAFPLCYSLPLRRLTKRFVKSGSALAGYVGADRLRRSNCVILTDTDLFPPGTVSLNGLKIYGEESGKVISYAATMAHASQSGLSRLFDTLLEGEGGRLEPLDDLSFYEEGGVSGLIHGETVLFGTAAFCRKMHVTMPGGLSLKTGAFLAVDGTLIAVFAVKYTAAENVDWALHALKRSRITPVLAVRDGSITPALLKRKFGTDARAVYPTISTRLALSEKDGEHPYALLYREGLMPYAEIAVGSKRLVHAVRVAAVLSLGSSAVSALLAFYLTFVGAYSALTPVSMLLYLLLWALAALIEGFWADRY